MASLPGHPHKREWRVKQGIQILDSLSTFDRSRTALCPLGLTTTSPCCHRPSLYRPMQPLYAERFALESTFPDVEPSRDGHGWFSPTAADSLGDSALPRRYARIGRIEIIWPAHIISYPVCRRGRGMVHQPLVVHLTHDPPHTPPSVGEVGKYGRRLQTGDVGRSPDCLIAPGSFSHPRPVLVT